MLAEANLLDVAVGFAGLPEEAAGPEVVDGGGSSDFVGGLSVAGADGRDNFRRGGSSFGGIRVSEVRTSVFGPAPMLGCSLGSKFWGHDSYTASLTCWSRQIIV